MSEKEMVTKAVAAGVSFNGAFLNGLLAWMKSLQISWGDLVPDIGALVIEISAAIAARDFSISTILLIWTKVQKILSDITKKAALAGIKV
jgi:hypothetical protein